VRGYRIELGEVEAALREQHGVSEAVVIAREEEQGNRRLVAYVVAEGEGTPGTTEMQGELRKRLPEYMVPSVFILLTEMPLTPRGKVDRRALPAPDRLRARSEVEFVAPRTAAEEVVAEIWMEILGLDRVGMYDNFFDLGGHSLLATQVLSQIQSIFRVDVPIQDLFQIPTVENLVEAISKVWGQREIVEEIARTYKHVGTLSPDEVQQSLSEQVQGTS
jgi:acyl carrier protein